jgi:hypothetical protein
MSHLYLYHRITVSRILEIKGEVEFHQLSYTCSVNTLRKISLPLTIYIYAEEDFSYRFPIGTISNFWKNAFVTVYEYILDNTQVPSIL